MKNENEEKFFSFLEEFELEEKKEWLELSETKMENCFKYITLMKRFMKNEKMLSKTHKKWMIENCDLPTHLIPIEQMEGCWL